MNALEISVTILVALSVLILLIGLTRLVEERDKKMFREEFNEIDRNILLGGYDTLIFDIVFMNAKGEKRYMHNKFDIDRFDLISTWLDEIGAEELLFEDYNELVSKNFQKNMKK